MYQALNILFFIFHISLILFNCLGWVWPKARRLHLLSIGLTWASWILLGIRYGFGYCPLTDWHFEVLRHLGKTDLPSSYLKYLVDTLTGLDVQAGLVDTIAVAGLMASTLIALYLFYFQRKKIKTNKSAL
jgi:hypothetical protein